MMMSTIIIFIIIIIIVIIIITFTTSTGMCDATSAPQHTHQQLQSTAPLHDRCKGSRQDGLDKFKMRTMHSRRDAYAHVITTASCAATVHLLVANASCARRSSHALCCGGNDGGDDHGNHHQDHRHDHNHEYDHHGQNYSHNHHQHHHN